MLIVYQTVVLPQQKHDIQWASCFVGCLGIMMLAMATAYKNRAYQPRWGSRDSTSRLKCLAKPCSSRSKMSLSAHLLDSRQALGI